MYNENNKNRLSFSSLGQLSNVYVLCICGLMGALAIALSGVATIKVGDYLRIGFSNIPNEIVAFLFGPWIGAIFGGAMDIIKWFLFPTGAFFPGYTLTAIVAGIIYGVFFYKRPIKIWRIIAAELLVKIFCNLGLNTLWIMMTTGNAFKAIVIPRIAANVAKLPADTIIMLIIFPVIRHIIQPTLLNIQARMKHKKTTVTED